MRKELQTTKKYYDTHSKEWVKKCSDLNFCLTEFKEFQKLLPSGRVLDLGCGTGRDASLFLSNNYNYIGIDISKPMIDEAKKLFKDASFQVMDLMSLDYPDNYFDGVWANVSFLHLPKSQINDAIGEMKRVMKPNGIGMVMIKKGNSEKYLGENENKRYWSFYQKDEFAKILENNNFSILKSYEYKKEYKRDYTPSEDVSTYLSYYIKK